MTRFCSLLLLVGLLAQFGIASAQDTAPPGASSPNQIAQPDEPATDDDTNLRTATPDPTPPARAPDPGSPSLGVVEQAGVGGPVPYGAAGVLEVGGAGMAWADDTMIWGSLRPFVGLFLADAIELTLTNEFVFTSVGGQDVQTALAIALEPSLHLPLVDRLWLAIGVGGGVVYNGVDAGALGNARLGLDLLVGRSAMIHMHAVGMLSSVPLAIPASTEVGPAHWRLGFEVAYAALF